VNPLRYDFNTWREIEDGEAWMVDSRNGDWVKYDDHAKLLSALLQQIEGLKEGLANYAQELADLREYLRDRLGNDYARLVEDIERRHQPQSDRTT
jgi:hypothetical protein